jgi:polyphosphate kinase 2
MKKKAKVEQLAKSDASAITTGSGDGDMADKRKNGKGKKDKKDKKGRKGRKGSESEQIVVAAASASFEPDSAPVQLTRKAYEKELEKLHGELVQLQEWVKAEGLKVCIVFEGRDGAGKGGTIKAITERVSPRVFRVVALPAPTEREKSQMYVQRYLPHFPAAGEVVIFDRSWYNRAGVERVLGFCSEETSRKFVNAVPWVERAMVDSGIILIKLWLEVSEEEQTRRLKDRIDDGRKIWKLSPMDLKSYNRWYDYSRARDDMFTATDTDFAPWYVVRSDDKKRARLNVIAHILERVPYKHLPREKVKLPKRQKAGDYRQPDYPYRYVSEKY